MLPPAPASSAKTTIRSAYDGALATAHEWKWANMSGGMIAVVICSNVVPIVGSVVALAIYAIYQSYHEPQKQRELFEEACNEAFADIKIENGESTMTYSTSNGYTVTYTENLDGLYVQKSFNGVEGEKEKHHFANLKELQVFRRKDLVSTHKELYGKICPEDLKPLWRFATLFSNLTAEKTIHFEPAVIKELKDIQLLKTDDIEAAYACLKGVGKNTNQFVDGLHLMKLAILHNTLSKIGTKAFDNKALENFMEVYNLGNKESMGDLMGKLPPLDKDSIVIMLALEKEKLNPDNAKDNGGSAPEKVQAAVNELVHDTFRPGETGAESEIKEIGQTALEELNFSEEEIELWKDLNGGKYDLGTACRMIVYKKLLAKDSKPSVFEFRSMHPAAKLALTHNYSKSDDITKNNNYDYLDAFNGIFKAYGGKKIKYNDLFSKIHAKFETLNVSTSIGARNGLFL